MAPWKEFPARGRRVTLSDAGMKALLGSAERRGVIVGESRDQTCWRVQWDSMSSPYTYHKDFIRILIGDS